MRLETPSLYTCAMPITRESSAPYAPVANVLLAINHYREKAPVALTKDLLMRLGLAGPYANRTLRALRLLDLIDDDGAPSDALRELRTASAEDFPMRLAQIVRTAYADIFEVVDPATATDDAIDTAFRFYDPAAQRARMVILFMGLCEASGIIPPERAPRRRSMKGAVRLSSTPRARVSRDTPKAAVKESVHDIPLKNDPPRSTDRAALKSRYIEVLIEKAASTDDDKLLDRIEALLRDDEPKD